MNNQTKSCLGIDIGGSSVKYGIVHEDGSITSKGTFKTSFDMGKDLFLSELHRSAELATANQLHGIGISTLGFIDSHSGTYVGGVENLPFLKGMNLKKELSDLYSPDKIHVNNDCNCFALGEMWKGNAQGVKDFFCIALGTGIGGSIVIDGKLLHGVHMRAGEIGYLRDPQEDSCLEARYSTKTFMQRAAKALNIPTLNGKEFADLVRTGHTASQRLFDEWMREIGRITANIILILDIDLIIIGGGVSESADLTIPALQAHIDSFLPSSAQGQCSIKPARFFNDSAIIGAVAPFMMPPHH